MHTQKHTCLYQIHLNFFNAWLCWAGTGHQGQLMYPLELQWIPRIDISSRGASAVPAFGPRKFLTRRSSIWSSSPTIPVQGGTHNGAANLKDNKNLNKCSTEKLCLITSPPIDRQRTEGKRTKIYARIKHSMLFLPVYQLTKIILLKTLRNKRKCNIRTSITKKKKKKKTCA